MENEQTQIQKKLTKQLRWLNINLTIFGLFGLAGLAVMAFLLFQVLVFVKDAGTKIESLQQTTEQLDVKSQVCGGNDSFSNFLKTNTDACR